MSRKVRRAPAGPGNEDLAVSRNTRYAPLLHFNSPLPRDALRGPPWRERLPSDSTSDEEANVASGVVTTSRQVGATLGIAVMGAIVAASESVPQADPRFAVQFVTGFHNALRSGAAIALLGAVLSAMLVGRERTPNPALRPHQAGLID